MRMRTLGALAIGLALGPSASAYGWCVTVQNAKCDTNAFSATACVLQPGSTCSRDGAGCRPSCDGAGEWDECDPNCPGGPDLQLP